MEAPPARLLGCRTRRGTDRHPGRDQQAPAKDPGGAPALGPPDGLPGRPQQARQAGDDERDRRVRPLHGAEAGGGDLPGYPPGDLRPPRPPLSARLRYRRHESGYGRPPAELDLGRQRGEAARDRLGALPSSRARTTSASTSISARPSSNSARRSPRSTPTSPCRPPTTAIPSR